MNDEKILTIGDVINPETLQERSWDVRQLATYLTMPNPIMWSWGLKDLVYKTDCFIRFSVNGMLHKGFVYIILGWNDTFKIYYTDFSNKIIDIEEEVYIDELINRLDLKIETKR